MRGPRTVIRVSHHRRAGGVEVEESAYRCVRVTRGLAGWGKLLMVADANYVLGQADNAAGP